MFLTRAAFLLSVHHPDEPAVLENLRTRERARINDLNEIPAQVRLWLAAEPVADKEGDS